MFHGHHDIGGPNFETGAFFFITALVSVFAAYYTMKFMVFRREAREKANKSLKNRLEKQ
jgi:hypothetical protein